MVNRQSWLNNTKNLGSAGTLDGDELIRLVDDPTGTPASKQTTVTGISNRVVTDLGSLGYTIEWAGPWQISTSYNLQEATEYSGSSYICILAHTSTLLNRPGTGVDWQTYWDVLALEGDISQASDYVTQAGLYATQALQARDDILSSLSSATNAIIYSTYADANAALGSLSEDDVVEVMIDETRSDSRTRYIVQSNALVYVLTLPRLIGITPTKLSTEYDDTESLKRAITEAGPGGVIDLLPGALYEVSSEVIPLQNQKIFGNGATIKKRNQIVVTTTTAITADVTTSVTLSDASEFRVGMQVSFIKSGVSRISAVYPTDVSTIRTITNISGDTITLNAAPTITAVVGSTCFLAFSSLNCLNSNTTVRDVIFDGNYANWPHGVWSVISEVLTGSLTTNCIIENCVIQNFPGEGITTYGDYSSIKTCYFKNGNGNGVHLSDCDSVKIYGCTFVNLNEETDIGHPDGAIAWSLGCTHTQIINNVMINCMAGVGGLDNVASSHAIISNNTIKDCVWFGINLGGSISNITISNNHIYNCGPTTGGDVASPSGSVSSPERGGIFFENVTGTDIQVFGNKIDGCSVYMSMNSVSRRTSVFDNIIIGAILISGFHARFTNNIITKTFKVGPSKWVKISNNQIHAPGNTTDLMLSVYSTTDYEDLEINNNIIIGGSYGISLGSAILSLKNVSVNGNVLFDQTTRGISAGSSTATVENVSISDNKIRVGSAALSGYSGILSSIEKITIKGNDLSNEIGASSRVAVNSISSSATKTIIFNNVITGSWSNAVSMVVDSGAFFINNFVDSGTIGSGTGNTISGTVTI